VDPSDGLYIFGEKFLASAGNQTLDHPGNSAVNAPTMLSRKSEIIYNFSTRLI
jgi:hypothetical protein